MLPCDRDIRRQEAEPPRPEYRAIMQSVATETDSLLVDTTTRATSRHGLDARRRPSLGRPRRDPRQRPGAGSVEPAVSSRPIPGPPCPHPPLPATAHRVRGLVHTLQARYATALAKVAKAWGHPATLTPVTWLETRGRRRTAPAGPRHSGVRPCSPTSGCITATCPKSHSTPPRSAVSCIRVTTRPAMHMHIRGRPCGTATPTGASWPTSTRRSQRCAHRADRARDAAAADTAWEEGRDQGDRYFYIPAPQRTRGVAHFTEGWNSGNWWADHHLAERFGISMIDTYCEILESVAAEAAAPPTSIAQQRAYHSLYLLQVSPSTAAPPRACAWRRRGHPWFLPSTGSIGRARGLIDSMPVKMPCSAPFSRPFHPMRRPPCASTPSDGSPRRFGTTTPHIRMP